ncbi:MAG: hypothetical protein NTY12_03175 [Candidatus Falkowbacteria bacterium]|nr:hypothetical protein [Candidatus Falkowbacteria bacterium]
MFKENKLSEIPINEDLHNEDVRQTILESGSKTEILRLKKFLGKNVSDEKFRLLEYFAKLRKTTIDNMDKEIENRRKTNPVANEKEMNMGAYIENIEPQVRATVLNLRQKGYNTYESGFDIDRQKISFEDKYSFLSKDFFSDLSIPDIKIENSDQSITFDCEAELSLEELKNAWEKIEKHLPNLNETAKPSQLSQARLFRSNQAELNK